jgi:hypothetical protein
MSGTEQAFQFDKMINRREVPSLKVHPRVIGSTDKDLFAAGVADMDFMALFGTRITLQSPYHFPKSGSQSRFAARNSLGDMPTQRLKARVKLAESV